ncbi:MAG: hypothetical protein PUC37_04320 [Spirochaetales bacterium]|nr:hypothetical protein [Spirochaetales bacterium]
MENTKKIVRNPLLAVGKVFKYEIICGARIIVPMYIILLSLSLIIGIFIMNKDLNFSNNVLDVFKAFIFILTCIMYFVMFVVTIWQIEKRFKKSLLGDEAYLNFTLPVTVGEHLWGRYLADAVWAVSYAVVSVISFMLMVIKGWNKIPEFLRLFSMHFDEFSDSLHSSVGSFVLMACLNAFMIFMLICVFAYMASAVSNLIGKHKSLISILLFIVCFILYSNISNCIFRSLEIYSASYVLLGSFLYNLVWTIIFSIVTRIIFYNRMDLE